MRRRVPDHLRCAFRRYVMSLGDEVKHKSDVGGLVAHAAFWAQHRSPCPRAAHEPLLLLRAHHRGGKEKTYPASAVRIAGPTLPSKAFMSTRRASPWRKRSLLWYPAEREWTFSGRSTSAANAAILWTIKTGMRAAVSRQPKWRPDRSRFVFVCLYIDVIEPELLFEMLLHRPDPGAAGHLSVGPDTHREQNLVGRDAQMRRSFTWWMCGNRLRM